MGSKADEKLTKDAPRHAILENHIAALQVTVRWNAAIPEKQQRLEYLTAKPLHLRDGQAGRLSGVLPIPRLVPLRLRLISINNALKSYRSTRVKCLLCR